MRFKTLLFTFIFSSFLFNYSSAQDETNPCLKAQEFHIVVLGSSTAAGAGPSSSDSTWVNRYRNFLQSINANNQVTNLAIGGTNTYQIMPSWFVPPVGRPSPNPTNNLTQAIALGADAVIINMPSNDAAGGIGTNEQMFNFHTMVSSADSVNIPVWICTTQPRVFNPGNIQIQIEVRDSILSAFGNMAIDFWTGLADTSGLPLSIYDSGDGVHLNDAGHNIFFNRVKDKIILSNLFVPSSSFDIATLDYTLGSVSVCGDSLTTLKTVIGNIGPDSAITIAVQIEVTNIDSGTVQFYVDSINGGLNSCSSDTITSSFSSYEGGEFQIKLFIDAVDSNLTNDTLVFFESYTGHPTINTVGDSACALDTLSLIANVNPGDTVLWYDSPTDSIVIAGGSSFVASGLSSSTTYYAEGVRGDLFYKNSIFTREQTGINFNGYMFDVFASTDLVIDSMDVKFNSSGPQIVELYTKSGSHLGFDTLPSAWTLWHTDSIIVDSADQFVAVDLNALNMNANDSIAIYIQLQNGSQLSYQWMSNPVTRTNNEISLINGSGVSHNFNSSFYPRDLAYELYYHHGFNPTGDCSTGRVPVDAIISAPMPDLGNDTAMCSGYDFLTLYPGNFFAYIWSSGTSASTFTIPSNYYPIGFNDFYVTVFDSLGCSARDSIVVNILLCSGLSELEANQVSVYPIPSNGLLHYSIQSLKTDFTDFMVYNLSGEVVAENSLNTKAIDLSNLDAGAYFLVLYNEDYYYQQKVTIVH
ncbi:MAG: T9SS type A sorting domain-containing protein [Bacteroidia bacterium]|nr:T9SS type A sorting domain-containing protein [Bacteroidia bacterium]